jgi:hypothetical protein
MGIVAPSVTAARGDLMRYRAAWFSGSRCRSWRRPKQPLTSHYVEDPNPLTVKPVEDPAGRLDNLPVSRTTELGRHGSAFWMPFQLFDMFKDSLDETARSLAVVQSNVIRDRVQIS